MGRLRVPALKEKVIIDLVSELLGHSPIYNDKTKEGRRVKWLCPHNRRDEIVAALKQYKGIKIRRSTISYSRLGQYGSQSECITVYIDFQPWKKVDVSNSFLRLANQIMHPEIKQ